MQWNIRFLKQTNKRYLRYKAQNVPPQLITISWNDAVGPFTGGVTGGVTGAAIGGVTGAVTGGATGAAIGGDIAPPNPKGAPT